jgi:hypothetical protein
MTLTPAYGRDYKTAKAVKADWKAGKDFIIADFGHKYEGKPANKEQLKNERFITIRFSGLRKVTSV